MNKFLVLIILFTFSSISTAGYDAWDAVRDPFAAVKKQNKKKDEIDKTKFKWVAVEDAPGAFGLFYDGKQVGYLNAKGIYRPIKNDKWGKACKPPVPVPANKKASQLPVSFPYICTT